MNKKTISFVIIIVLIILTWYFYPTLNYKGTYISSDAAKYEFKNGKAFVDDDEEGMNYKVNFLKRRIELELNLPDSWKNDPKFPNYWPLSLNWGYLESPNLKGGQIKYEKQ